MTNGDVARMQDLGTRLQRAINTDQPPEIVQQIQTHQEHVRERRSACLPCPHTSVPLAPGDADLCCTTACDLTPGHRLRPYTACDLTLGRECHHIRFDLSSRTRGIVVQVRAVLDAHASTLGAAGGMSTGLSAEGSDRLTAGVQIQAQLQDAISREDYALAAELRDKISKLQVHS